MESGDSVSTGRWAPLIVLAIAATVFFSGLGSTRLWDRDEPRNAGCAAAMLEAGDWIVPRFNGELRFQKPALTYWLMMTAYKAFGVNEFAARFWSALLGSAVCLMTWWIGRRVAGPGAGFWAGLILPGTVMFTVASRAATPDAPLIACWTAALAVFVAAGGERWQERESLAQGPWFPGWKWVAGFYGLIGLGTLAKGLAGVVPPLMIAGLFLAIVRTPRADRESASQQKGALFRVLVTRMARFHAGLWNAARELRLFSGLAVALLVAGPWFVAVGLATEGEFTRLFFLREHLGRATTSFEGHGGGPWYYPAALLAGLFPWSLLAVPAGLQLWRQRRNGLTGGQVFALLWVAVTVGLFSIARTKLPSYVTPCYPAVAILLGTCLADWTGARSRIGFVWLRISFGVLAGTGALIALALAWLARDRGVHPAIVLAAVPLVLAGAWLVWASRPGPMAAASTERVPRWPYWMAGAAVGFQWCLFVCVALAVDATRKTGPLTDLIRDRKSSEPVVAWRCLEGSWVWYGQTRIIELETTPLALAAGHGREASSLFPENLAGRWSSALVVVPEGAEDELRARAGGTMQRMVAVPDFLRDRTLLLLRWSAEPRGARMSDVGDGRLVR